MLLYSMGYRLQHNPADIISKIRSLGYECRDMRTDSYIAWGIKQDLYRIKWAIDDALSKSPNFSLEEEWLKDIEQEKIIEILKNDI